mmetsp:Transcript_34697/g.77613  ORF Transcript_34697/g.77613 Transcript_34697/m.77613 type:complete len:218 (+) Transcript_34697:891-1544(+)
MYSATSPSRAKGVELQSRTKTLSNLDSSLNIVFHAGWLILNLCCPATQGSHKGLSGPDVPFSAPNDTSSPGRKTPQQFVVTITMTPDPEASMSDPTYPSDKHCRCSSTKAHFGAEAGYQEREVKWGTNRWPSTSTLLSCNLNLDNQQPSVPSILFGNGNGPGPLASTFPLGPAKTPSNGKVETALFSAVNCTWHRLVPGIGASTSVQNAKISSGAKT